MENNFDRNLQNQTNIAMANGMLKKLKENHPNLSWNGNLSINLETKIVSGQGFTDEEMEIIKNIKLT